LRTVYCVLPFGEYGSLIYKCTVAVKLAINYNTHTHISTE